MTQPTPPTPVRASAPALVRMWGDKFLPPAGGLSAKAHLPCRDVKVGEKDLATLIGSMAFWSLRERGLLRLEVVSSKKLFVTFTHVQATPIAAGEAPALETSLLQRVGGGRSVHDAVRALWRTDAGNPWGDVCELAVHDAITSGQYLVVDAHRGALTGFVLGKTKVEPVCEAVAACEPDAQGLHGAWSQFEEREPDLARELSKQVGGAIRSRLEQSSNTDI